MPNLTLWLGGVAVGRRIRDREVASSFPGCSATRCNSGQVVHTHVPMFSCSPNSINWYRLRLGVKCTTGAVWGMLAAIRRTLRLAANRRHSSIVLTYGCHCTAALKWLLSLTPLYNWRSFFSTRNTVRLPSWTLGLVSEYLALVAFLLFSSVLLIFFFSATFIAAADKFLSVHHMLLRFVIANQQLTKLILIKLRKLLHHGSPQTRWQRTETWNILSKQLQITTRKLCYLKDDRAMRPIHGCPEIFWDTLTTPKATYSQHFSWAFVSIDPMNISTKFEVRNFTRS